MSPPNLPATAADQLTLLSTFLDELDPYLVSKELFWPLGGKQQQAPRLTLGNLLLAMRTLESPAASLDVSQQAQLHKLQTRWHQARVKMASAISAKALREMGARLNLWQGFLTDLSESQGKHYLYASEVRNRVLFALLATLPLDEEEVSRLLKSMASLDNQLAAYTKAAPFQWEEELEAAFAREAFPYLYRTLRA
jgi:outer membrane PBP1 activator LpoA protein